MRHLFSALILLAAFAAPAYAQTMKALMYSTNGNVIAPNIAFTNQVSVLGVNIAPNGVIQYDGSDIYDMSANSFVGAVNFDDPTSTRANLGFSTNLNTLWTATNASNARSAVSLGATWLTNTNATNFRAAVGLDRIWAYKSTNQTNATTNLVSDSALTFTAAANTKYAVELFLVAKSSMAALQGKINSTNATPFGFWVEYDAASQFAWLAGNGVTNRATLVSFDGNDVSVWQRFVIVAPTNSTTVTFQFAPANTNGNAVISAGSYLKAEVIE